MFTLSAVMEQEGIVFELPIGSFPTLVEAAGWLEKYGAEVLAIQYNIKREEA